MRRPGQRGHHVDPFALYVCGPAGKWTLKSIASLVGEYWSDLGVTVSGGKVTAWADQSGVSGAAWSQGTVDKQPAYEAAGWGGDSGPSILFDGNGFAPMTDSLEAAGLATYLAGTDQPYTVIVEAQFVTFNVGSNYFFNAYNSVGPARSDFMVNSLNNYQAYRSDDTGAGVGPVGAAGADTNRHVISYVFSGTAVSSYEDGVVQLNGVGLNVGACSFSTVYLGNLAWAGAYGANIRIVHCSVYNAALSSTERALAEAYIVARRPK